MEEVWPWRPERGLLRRSVRHAAGEGPHREFHSPKRSLGKRDERNPHRISRHGKWRTGGGGKGEVRLGINMPGLGMERCSTDGPDGSSGSIRRKGEPRLGGRLDGYA